MSYYGFKNFIMVEVNETGRMIEEIGVPRENSPVPLHKTPTVRVLFNRNDHEGDTIIRII